MQCSYSNSSLLTLTSALGTRTLSLAQANVFEIPVDRRIPGVDNTAREYDRDADLASETTNLGDGEDGRLMLPHQLTYSVLHARTHARTHAQRPPSLAARPATQHTHA